MADAIDAFLSGGGQKALTAPNQPRIIPDSGQMLMPPTSGTESPDQSLFNGSTQTPQPQQDDAIGAFLMAPPANAGGGGGDQPPSASAPNTDKSYGGTFLAGIKSAGAGAIGTISELVDPTPMFGYDRVGAVPDLSATKKAAAQVVDKQRAEYAPGLVGQGLGYATEVLANPLNYVGGRGATVAKEAGSAVTSLVSRLVARSGQGAVEGLAQGVGTEDSRGTNAALGAGGAAALTGLAATGKGVAKGARAAGSAAKTLTYGRTADEVLADIISKSGKTPDEILTAIQGGTISGIADVGGDTVQGLTRSVAKTQGGKDVISQGLESRAVGASARVADDIDAGLGKRDYFQNLDQLKESRSKQAAPLYQEAYKSNKAIQSNEIDRVLDTPAGKSALNDAVSRMRNDQSLVGIPDKELNEQAKLIGLKLEGGVASGLNLRTLDYVKRGLDKQINDAFRSGDNNLGGILTGLKNKLVSELDKADVTGKAGPRSLKPEGGAYARARKVSSDSFQLEEAQKLGREFDSAKMRPAQIQKALADMSDAEKEAYRIGARERAQTILERNSDRIDVSKSLFGNQERRERLKAILGPQQFSTFEKRMLEESNASRTAQRVLGGSRTDFNVDVDQGFSDFFEQAASSGLKAATVNKIVGKATSFISNRFQGISEANAKQIGKALIDREEGIKTLQRIYGNQINKSSPTAKAAQQAIQTLQTIQGKPLPASTNTANSGKIRIPVKPTITRKP